jgi:hypothetical protein
MVAPRARGIKPDPLSMRGVVLGSSLARAGSPASRTDPAKGRAPDVHGTRIELRAAFVWWEVGEASRLAEDRELANGNLPGKVRHG